MSPYFNFMGVIEPVVSDMSFRPEVRMDWQRGRGLEVGLRMDYDGDAGVDVAGTLGPTGPISTQRVETPDVTLLTPAGLALPFKLTVRISLGGVDERGKLARVLTQLAAIARGI